MTKRIDLGLADIDFNEPIDVICYSLFIGITWYYFGLVALLFIGFVSLLRFRGK